LNKRELMVFWGRKIELVVVILSLIFCGSKWGACEGRGVEERGKTMFEKNIRESVIAGSWYPGDPARLTEDIKKYLELVPARKMAGELIALIVPHAGYMYSGQVAAYAYKLLEGKSYEVVLIVAPSHHVYLKGASVYIKGGYRTPLGIVPVMEELTEALIKKSPLISYFPKAHVQEHSLEIQLPFLQVVLKDFRLVPIVMGEQDFYTCEELSKAIVEVVKGRRALLIASTDLSHFHPYARAVELDQVVLKHVNNLDPEGLSKALKKGMCEACGGGPTVAVMLAARAFGANHGEVLKYANSGDVTGDHGSVVGYMAAALYRSANPEKGKKENKVGVDLGLSEEERRTLHEIARTVIMNRVLGKSMPEYSIKSKKLNEPCGAFVSLHKKGTLRGCIGYVRGIKPLYKAVEEMAAAAAFNDPRFPPIKERELDDIDIEISVLTPLKKIDDINEIEVGKHGIFIEKGFFSGLLLPQVATEYGWDRKTFLEQTCLKAGLPCNAWKDKETKIHIFSADIF
jgi:AmmeMemoRadiSam system protein B/AmmeMemoRadiSam system protein A